MKYLLLLLLISCTSTVNKNEFIINKNHFIDHKTSAFYIGCIEGFINVDMLNGYKRPPQHKSAYSAFNDIMLGCRYRTLLYQYSVEKDFMNRTK